MLLKRFSGLLLITLLWNSAALATEPTRTEIKGKIEGKDLVIARDEHSSELGYLRLGMEDFIVQARSKKSIEARREIKTLDGRLTEDRTILVNFDKDMVRDMKRDPQAFLASINVANADTAKCEEKANAVVFVGDNFNEPFPLNVYCIRLQ